jgi:UDP-N-acetylmuramate--alanine ligase
MINDVLLGIRQQFPGKKIWCLYQPGSYLRTKSLFADYQTALKNADFVYMTDIKGYPKEKSEGLNIRHLIAEMRRQHPQTYYFDDAMDMTGLLSDRVASTDCIVTLGVEGVCQTVTKPLLPEVGEEE